MKKPIMCVMLAFLFVFALQTRGYALHEEDGRIAVRDNSIAVRETDPAKVHAKQLTIFGAYLMDDVHQQTIRDMNGVSVYSLPTAFFSSAREMAQSLVSGEDGIDILSIRSNFIDVKKLMNKGYTVDLSANRALRDYVSSLYPSIGEIGQYDGKLFMVPVYLGPNSVLNYFTKPFELVQDDAALPATYDELIDLIQRWNDELVDLYPDIVPMLNSDYKVQMVNLAITLYKDASAMQGNEFDFKDPILMRMLERALTLRTENIYAKVDPASPDTQARLDELYGKMPLFTSDWTWFDLDSLEKPLNNNDDGTMISAQTGSGMGEAGFALPLQLTIGKGEKPVTSINLTLLAVNPRSKNIDTAIEYIEKFIQNISPSQRVMMNPNMNDPIPNPEYEQEVIWRALHLAAIKEELQTALGAKKTELEQNYESTKQAYRLNSVKIKYTLHQETIDLYRRLVANSYITLFSHNTGLFGDDMTILRRRLTDGQISLEQFVNEANGKLRLKRLEGQ